MRHIKIDNLKLRRAIWSPQSNLIALFEIGEQIRLYDRNLAHMRSIVGLDEYIGAFSWAPDGNKYVVSDVKRKESYSGRDFNRVIVRDLEGNSLMPLFEYFYNEAEEVKWSPDGRFIAVAFFADVQYVRLYESETGELTRMLPLKHKGLRGLSWSPNGTYIAALDGQESMQIWHVDSGETALSVPIQRGVFAWNPNGSRIAVRIDHEQTQVQIWDLFTGELMITLPKHKNTYRHAHSLVVVDWLSQDRLISLDTDGRVTVWDSATGKQVTEIRDETFTSFSVSDGDGLVALCGSETIYTWHAAKDQLSKFYAQSDAWACKQIQWSPDGTILYGTDYDLNHAFWYRDTDFTNSQHQTEVP